MDFGRLSNSLAYGCKKAIARRLKGLLDFNVGENRASKSGDAIEE
jgi:hypothetical protein